MARAGTVLLVEDDTHDVELMQLALDHACRPFEFHSVPHGKEAVSYLLGDGKYADREKFPLPELILLDLAMPVMDGFDVLRWMQQRSDAKWPPVFVFSYSRLEPDVRRAGELGARQYVLKPIDLNSAVALIRSLDEFRKGGNFTLPAG